MTAAIALSADAVRKQVEARLAQPYCGYLYAYPHKSTYRPLDPAVPLSEVWREERQSGAGIYVHVPFCEMRCGFCNLFTLANPDGDGLSRYLAAFVREVEAVVDSIGPIAPASLTLGGGTPTFLEPVALEAILNHVTKAFAIDLGTLGSSVETSPGTATAERLDLLASRGFGRISIGVQSFVEAEAARMGRPQRNGELAAALDRIRARPFRTLNIDLIYGSDIQTVATWLYSLQTAMVWAPEEIFLYPLYVRPLTGLAGRTAAADAHRLELYRLGRDFLMANGYRQHSMRMFRKAEKPASGALAAAIGSAGGEAGEIAMNTIGLGCGSRSRTRALHYSTPFAVGRSGVMRIIADYCQRSAADFATARHGVWLDRAERMRRTIALQVLCAGGLDLADFAARYGCSALTVLPELPALIALELLEQQPGRIVPTAAGLELADAIGPLLVSPAMEARMAAFERQ